MKTAIKIIVLLIGGVVILAALSLINPAFAATAVEATSRENTAWFILSVALIVLFSIA